MIGVVLWERQLPRNTGFVFDLNDRPLSGVQVKLFIDGQLAATVSTDVAGHYDLQSSYDPGADVTALLWFVAPDRSLMPKELVLRESKGSRENALISPCVPRADFLPGKQFRVYLFDLPSRNKELAELNCLP